MFEKGTHLIWSGKYLILLTLLGVYFLFNPATSGWFPACPFYSLTGFQCPGCGSQRAIHSLLHLDIGRAFHYNPLLVLALPYLLVGLLFYKDAVKQRFPKIRQALFGVPAIVLWCVILFTFWIGRNLL